MHIRMQTFTFHCLLFSYTIKLTVYSSNTLPQALNQLVKNSLSGSAVDAELGQIGDFPTQSKPKPHYRLLFQKYFVSNQTNHIFILSHHQAMLGQEDFFRGVQSLNKSSHLSEEVSGKHLTFFLKLFLEHSKTKTDKSSFHSQI